MSASTQQQTANQALRAYRQALRQTHDSGQATEHSYRPAFKSLIEALGGDGSEAINEPARIEAGAPDFIVQRRGVPIGHIECKDIGENLDAAERSEQLKRYREALPNLILTDYLEFRWYAEGELRATARLGRFDSSGAYTAESGGGDAVRALLDTFSAADHATIDDPADLARRMAGKTRLLRDTIRRILEDDDEPAALGELLASYREVLISDLDADEFADLQAQTAAYGLFAARCLHDGPPKDFTRQSAVFAQTTPFLSDVFTRVAGPNADARIAWIMDDLALLLARADMAAVLEDFGKSTQQEDPVVHFYEDFLAAYDPRLRELRGVYYTPEPVVSYIVRSVDRLLRDEFGLADGLADTATVEFQVETDDGMETRISPRVLILDPAAGTGTFLREVVSLVRRTIAEKGLGGAWPDYVREHLLPRLFGFELLMAPYAICHLKLAIEIGGEQGAFAMPEGERLNVFLTNSLEEAHEGAIGPLFAAEIAREAREADAVKRDRPVMVVLGNPPYSGHSANKGKWIRDLMRGRVEGEPESYFAVDGQPLGERNPKWLNNDYVKFIRFAQWRIEQTREGVLGFVTDHGYLDAPTMRGMRQSLMTTFDEIWLLDLHGNSRKRERTPDGGPDENVFDIQQGVAVGLFVRRKEGNGLPARVFHADLWGEREGGADGGKYGWLAANDIASTDWTELAPRSPHYLFVPRDEALADEYEAGWELTDILRVNSVGIVTARDKLAIQWTRDDMREVAERFAGLGVEAARRRYRLGKDSSDWRVADAQQDIRDHGGGPARVAPILYRPFDVRTTYYTGRSGGVICRPRPRVMRHMLAGRNLGLIATRQTRDPWAALATRSVIGHKALAAYDIGSLFPLWLYPTEADAMELGVAERTANLAPPFTGALADATGLRFAPDGPGDLEETFGPEDVFHYIYAVLHSPEYRRRYADFLKSDFPRVPPPGDRALFAELVGLGARLAALHLMEADGASAPAFTVAGDNRVERVRYAEPSGDTPGRVWINGEQHFEGVSPETWAFTIGGYRPAEKWLKDRKGRTLSFDDIAWYRRVCAALAETPRVMARIDEAIETHGGWPLGA